MKKDIVIIGIGRGGSAITNCLHNKGYLTMIINPSVDDLDSFDLPDELKLHVPTGKGCHKDRNVALELVYRYHDFIIDKIEKNFPKQKHFFICYSTGGGSGAGISPILTDMLINRNPNKNFSNIIILPSDNELPQIQANSIETYNSVMNITNLKNLYVIDNNYAQNDLYEFNYRFVNIFDRFINITEPNEKGVIDEGELEKMITTSGNVMLSYFNNNNILESIKNNGIFAPFKKGCEYMAVSFNEECDTFGLENILGEPNYCKFIGYNQKSNFVACVGMPPIDPKRIERMNRNIQHKINDTSETINYDYTPIEVPNIIRSRKNILNTTKNILKNTIEDYNPKKQELIDIFNKYNKK